MNEKIPVVMVTGYKGLLGSTLMRTAIGGHALVALTADIRDAGAVLSEIEECKPRWVIHAAAKTDVAQCERNPDEARAVNVKGTKNIVDAARRVSARVIYISTVSVFDGRKGNYAESDTPNPVNIYNITKRDGELATLKYEKGIILRLNIIGVHPDGSRGRNFLEWLVNSIHANKDVTLFNDQFVNPLSNWTISELIKMMIEKNVQEKILHIGSGDTLSKAKIGNLVLKQFPDYRGTVTEQSIESIADGVIRPKQMWLNCARAKRVLGKSLPTIASEVEAVFSAMPFNAVVS
ncbi:SDR family oxidoreductase [Candidatus Kaiserbacteria bacterium]|nr:SDR family oxidoreductase [Candidatus Kaiserbacteria bacterium]